MALGYAETVEYLESFELFLASSIARQAWGEHVCMAKFEPTPNGSPETLVDDGVEAGAKVTGAWVNQLCKALEPAQTEFAILSVLQRFESNGFRLDDFAKVAEDKFLRGCLLGALDSQWERDNEEVLQPIHFALNPIPANVTGGTFNEVLKHWDKQQVLTRPAFDALQEGTKRKAFTVARMASRELLDTTHAELRRQIELGRTGGQTEGLALRDFHKFAKQRLESAGWTPASPSHVECLPADALVSGAVVRAAHRRWYEGPMVEVVTASGRKFSTTPNHPMLTRGGWVGTGALREGDDLIGYRVQQRPVPVRDQDVAAPPATIAEVFRACEVVGRLERVRSTDHDFHGDGRKGNVDIARPARVLRIGSFAALREPIDHDLFTPSQLAGSRFCNLCHHLIVVTEECGFCGAPDSHASAAQHATNRVVAGAEFLRELIGALARSEAPRDLLRRQIIAYARGLAAVCKAELARLAHGSPNTSRPNGGDYWRHRDAEDLRDGAQRLPGDVEFDRVISVSVRHFSGHVFNLSTEHGYFTIGGLFTGNTIFRTNVISAYSSGRFTEMRQPAVLAAMPYWQWRAIRDPRTRETHKAAHGIILRADDPFWKHAYPPAGYNCRCTVCARSEAWMKRNGAKVGPTPHGLPDPGFDSGTKTLIQVPDAALKQTPDAPAPVAAPPAPTPGLGPPSPFPAVSPFAPPMATPSLVAPLPAPTLPGLAPPSPFVEYAPPVTKPPVAKALTEQDFAKAGVKIGQRWIKQVTKMSEKILGQNLTPELVHSLMGLKEAGVETGAPVAYSIFTRGKDVLQFDAEFGGSTISRSYSRVDGELVVHHELFKLSEEMRAGGVGKKILRAQALQYDKLGVDRIETEAAWDGQYVWPRMGFALRDPQDLGQLKLEFSQFLAETYGLTPERATELASHAKSVHELAMTRVTASSSEQAGKDFLIARGNSPRGQLIELQVRKGQPEESIFRSYLGLPARGN